MLCILRSTLEFRMLLKRILILAVLLLLCLASAASGLAENVVSAVTPTPPPCPSEGPVTATVVVHYWGTSVASGKGAKQSGPCQLHTSGAPTEFSSQVTVAPKDSGISVSFTFYQPTLRSRRSLLHQDNVMIGPYPKDPFVPTKLSAPADAGATLIQVDSLIGAFVGGRIQLQKNVPNETYQQVEAFVIIAIQGRTLTLSEPLKTAYTISDYIYYLKDTYFSLLVTAYGECKVLAPTRYPAKLEPCTAMISHTWNAPCEKVGCDRRYWEGTVLVPYTMFRTHHVPADFDLETRRNYYVSSEANGKPSACPTGFAPAGVLCAATYEQAMTITFLSSAAVGDAVVSGGPDFGNPNPAPPHRTVLNSYAPFSVSTLAESAFSDDAGPVLSIRDQAVKASLSGAQAKNFACHSCGSFQADDQQPFSQAFTSKSTLGVDFSQLGFDNLPFSFNAASFPIDAGYKLISGVGAQIAVASFRGTTSSNGVANDNVTLLQNTFKSAGDTLYVSFYGADATRSQLAAPSKGAYFPFTVNELHTVNTQGTIGFTSLSADMHNAQYGISELPVYAVTSLLRYATQYMNLASDLEAAISIQRDPPALDVHSFADETWHFSGALGYRNVGRNYMPIDAPLDTYVGEHGVFGVLNYTGTNTKNGKPYTLALSGRRFSDTLEARDVSLGLDATFPIAPVFSLKGSYATANTTVLEAARQAKFIAADANGGNLYLPNGHYSGSLVYDPVGGKLQASLGYTRAESQGCNKQVTKAPPCYAYIQPSATGSLDWQMFSDLFLHASLVNSASDPFRAGDPSTFPDPSKGFYTTTATRVEYSYAVGANIFKTKTGACSTLLLTNTNRTSGIDDISNSPKQARFVSSASIDLIPYPFWPTFLAAYNRVGYIDPTNPMQTLFVFRIQYGFPPKTFFNANKRTCS